MARGNATNRSRRRRSAAVALAALAMTASAVATPAADLRPLPDETMQIPDAEIRALVEERRAAVDRLLGSAEASSAELAEAFGELGKPALHFGDRALAEAALSNAAALAPSDPRWPYLLGVLHQQDRELDAATAAFESTLALDPDRPAARLRLAQVRLLAGDPEAAAELLPPLAEGGPYAAAALYGLGRVEALAERYEAAIERFEAALELQPQAAEIRQQLGLAYRALGRREEARRHLEAGAADELRFPDPLVDALGVEYSNSHVFRGLVAERNGRWEEAVSEYRQAVAAAPDDATYRQALAGALMGSGDAAAAVAEYREALRLEPDDAMGHVLLGRALLEAEGATPDAVAALTRGVELAPRLKDARMALAGALFRVGRMAEAEPHLAVAAELAPDDPVVRLRWGQALVNAGDAQRAREVLAGVVEEDPENREAALALAQALSRLDEREAALEILDGLAARDWSASRKAVVHAELAELHERAGRIDQAIDHYRETTALVPELMEPQMALASALLRAGRHREAADTYELVLLLDPENREARRRYASALAGTDEVEAAAAELETLVAGDPGAYEAQIDLAGLRAEGGDLEGAVRGLRDALEAAEEPEATALLAYNAANLEQARGNAAAAAALYERAIAAAPDFRDAHFNLGVTLASMQRFSDARRLFERAAELDPADVEARLAAARAAASERDYAAAVATLREARAEGVEAPALTAMLVQLLLGSPDVTQRDPAAAVPLARELVESGRTAQTMALLAASLAATGALDEAVEWQVRAVENAETAGLASPQIELLRRDLERYRQGAAGGS